MFLGTILLYWLLRLVSSQGSCQQSQLGRRTGGDSQECDTRPRRVEGRLKKEIVIDVAAGQCHSVAVTDDGDVYTWGENTYGQLGHMEAKHVSAPRRVESLVSAARKKDGSTRRFRVVAAATTATCVLTTSGRVWQFGNGTHIPGR